MNQIHNMGSLKTGWIRQSQFETNPWTWIPDSWFICEDSFCV